MKRSPLLNVTVLVVLAAMWLHAYNNRTPSLNSAYALNLAPLGYTEPTIPSSFSSTAPVALSFVNSGLEVHLEYDDGPDFYRTAYEEGWSQCLDYYIYPSKASWRFSEAYFPWVTETLPTGFSRDHLAWARRDGFKACSDRIESLLASDPDLHSKLLIPAWHRFVWSVIISVVALCWMLLGYVYAKWRNNQSMHASGRSRRNQMDDHSAATA